MYDGEHFRLECLRSAQSTDDGIVQADPIAADRARKWGGVGGDLIDHEDAEVATRYLLATIGNIMDQNAVNTQLVVATWWRRALLPLWLSAGALLWIAWKSAA